MQLGVEFVQMIVFNPRFARCVVHNSVTNAATMGEVNPALTFSSVEQSTENKPT